MENKYHTIRGRTKSPRTLESNSKDPLSAAKPYIIVVRKSAHFPRCRRLRTEPVSTQKKLREQIRNIQTQHAKWLHHILGINQYLQIKFRHPHIAVPSKCWSTIKFQTTVFVRQVNSDNVLQPVVIGNSPSAFLLGSLAPSLHLAPGRDVSPRKVHNT